MSRWFYCRCGHALYDHQARNLTSTPGLTYRGCKTPGCGCADYRSETGQRFEHGTLQSLHTDADGRYDPATAEIPY